MELIDVHPTETAGDGKTLKDTKHLAPKEPSENLFIQCPHCGMFNKTNRDVQTNREGEGLKIVTVNQKLEDGTTKAIKESQRVSGCSLCGHDYSQSSYRRKFFSTTNLAVR